MASGADGGSAAAVLRTREVDEARDHSAQASSDKKDASQECTRDFRLGTCARFGPAPYDPPIDPANFAATIDNPYYPLSPGTTFIYEGQTAQGLEHNEVFVTRNTRVIFGVTCVEVLDTVKLNGELTEQTLDRFAQDRDGNVWYFGENSQELAGGLVVDLGGSFIAGVDGAQPGIIMKAILPSATSTARSSTSETRRTWRRCSA